jgi:hypothetical protein
MTRLLTAIALCGALTACASSRPAGWELTPDLRAAQPAPWRAPAISVAHLRCGQECERFPWRKMRPSENVEDRRLGTGRKGDRLD